MSLMSDLGTYIKGKMALKADINGNSTEDFIVPTTPVSNNSAVSKEYVDLQQVGAVHQTDYATPTVGGTVKMRVDGDTLYLSNNEDDA